MNFTIHVNYMNLITGSTDSRRSPGYYLNKIPTYWVENKYKSFLLKKEGMGI